MILLFTTTYRDLYKRDILNVCSLPDGACVQFGYKQNYIADYLQPQAGRAMQDQDALIIFCEYRENEEVQLRYHPIRLARIGKPHQDPSGSFELPLRLQGLYNYGGDQAAITAALDEFQGYVAKSNDRPPTTRTEANPGSGHRKRYVRSDDAWKVDRFNGDWETLVAYMRGRLNLRGSVFLRTVTTAPGPPLGTATGVVGLRTEGGLPEPAWNPHACRADYTVEGGKSYDLTIRLLFGEAAEHWAPELVVREEVVTPCGPFLKQSGGGMDATFVLAFKRSFQEELSTFVVRVPPQAGGAILSAELFGILRIVAPKSLLVTAIVLLVLGTLLQSLGTEVKDVAKALGAPDAYAGVFSWLAKGIGALLFGVGAYIGFRKLPIKGGG